MKSVAELEKKRTEEVPPVSGTWGRREVELEKLLRLLPLQTVAGDRKVSVRGVAVDSRDVVAGYLFVAIEGHREDGNRFVADALRRGASAIVSERPPALPGEAGARAAWIQTPDARKAAGLLAAEVAGWPAKAMDLVGVTGTNGKTTTAFLVDGLLSSLAPPSLMLGTVVAKIDDRSRPTRHTTPEAPAIQSFLAEGVEASCGRGVLEVSSHGLALSRLEGAEFQVAVFTNLSRDHLDFHRDMEDYFQAKRLLFTRYLRPRGTAVVGIDDAYGERLASELDAETVTFGASETADLAVVEAKSSLEGIELAFRDGGRVERLKSPLLGSYNVQNLLAAVGAGRALGFEMAAILEALEQVSAAPGRFERVSVEGLSFHVVVDYAHTDDALRKLLTAARPLANGKLTVVFGCGGERDRAKRPLMGDVASRLADRVVLTSDNPRGEDPQSILREIQLGVKGEDVEVEPDRRKAIELALSRAGAGDLIVIAGKGHEPYQIVGDRVLDFDDRKVAREILERRKESSS